MKNYISFLNDYYSEYEKNINPDWLFDSLEQAKNKILEVQKLDGKLIFLEMVPVPLFHLTLP